MQSEQIILRTEPVTINQIRSAMSSAGPIAQLIMPWNSIDTTCGRGVVEEGNKWVLWIDNGTVITISLLGNNGLHGSAITHGKAFPGTYEHFRNLYPKDTTKGSHYGLEQVFKERYRQLNEKHFDAERDDTYTRGQLASAATCYLEYESGTPGIPDAWPWDKDWWKPKGKDRNLERAGALWQAEIDRLGRFLCRSLEDGSPKRLIESVGRLIREYALWRDEVASEIEERLPF